MAFLRGRELEPRDDPARLVDVVRSDSSFEVFPQRLGLPQLASQPAEKTDLRAARHSGSRHVASRLEVTKPSRSYRRTAPVGFAASTLSPTLG